MSTATAWTMLLVAGFVDVVWAVTMKLSQGYTRPLWTIASLVSLAIFVFLLGRALAALPVGSAYAVWTGIGAAGTLLVGAFVFAETLTSLRLLGVGLIVLGIALLHSAKAA